MKSLPVTVRPWVYYQMLEMEAYITADAGAKSGSRFLQAVEATFDRLKEDSTRGSNLETSIERLRGLRYLTVKGFKKHFIVFRVEETRLYVVGIHHTSKDIANLRID